MALIQSDQVISSLVKIEVCCPGLYEKNNIMMHKCGIFVCYFFAAKDFQRKLNYKLFFNSPKSMKYAMTRRYAMRHKLVIDAYAFQGSLLIRRSFKSFKLKYCCCM